MIQNLTTIDVRYYETDQMGIVHHSNYIKYFEIARLNWLNQIGFCYKEMEDNNIILPVISVQCKYLKSAFFGDELTIITELVKVPSVKIEFEYIIQNQKNEILIKGNTVLAFLNKQSKRPIRCPEYLLKKIIDLKQV